MQGNPFGVSRLEDGCLTQAYADQVKADLDQIDKVLAQIDGKSKQTREQLAKIKQTQKSLYSVLTNLQHGLEAHRQFEKAFAHVTVDRTKKLMLNVSGKRLPLKVVPWKSGREKSLYLKEVEKKKQASKKRKIKKRPPTTKRLKLGQ